MRESSAVGRMFGGESYLEHACDSDHTDGLKSENERILKTHAVCWLARSFGLVFGLVLGSLLF